MSNDKTLLDAFRRAGRRKLTTETLGILSGLSRRDINEKLKSMEKFGRVRPAEKQKIRFWELLDD